MSAVGLPWPFAVVAAGAVVFVALREKVTDIVPAPPPQTVSAYQSSWQQYRRLRKNARYSLIAFGISFVALGVAMRTAERHLSETTQAALSIGFLIALVALMIIGGYHDWKLRRWPCPRCGRAFRGFWAVPWMPKRCVYCGLPRWTEDPGDVHRP
ncbi:MAG TPA: hypothetical protein VJW93_14390 [Candidatus Acidoferrales bacterium]|nr:hypothetical protein [Candidatus Acidoferrales bacterium]